MGFESRSEKRHDDAEDVFGRHVAHQLREMPDTAMKGYAELKIQEVLFNSRFGQFSNLQQQQYHGARDSPSFSRQQ